MFYTDRSWYCYVPVKSKLQHPPPRVYPGHLTPFPTREGGHLITTHRGWGIWSNYGEFAHNSPVILWKNIGQPPTNCNRRFFNGFRPCNVPLKTYQKSQNIPLREVNEKRNLLWSSETRFMSAWERGWPKLFLQSTCEDLQLSWVQ